jgi:NADP-dependent 3-hydroxy acid dehydrogenase YdfG
VTGSADADVVALLREQTGQVSAVLHAGDAIGVLAALQALAQAPVPLLVLTRHGVYTGPGDEVEPALATLPGLVRTAVAERTLPFVRQVDLPAHNPATWVPALRAEVAREDGVAVVAYRHGQRLVPRLRAVEPEPGAGPGFVAGGTYLITGGLGGIGRLVAQYLLAAFGARLLLVGRGVGPDLADLEDLGEVAYRAVDVAETAAVRDAVEYAERRWGRPLAGVLHLAGAEVSDHWRALEAHTLTHERPETFHAMYRAKVAGTMAIAALLQDRPDATLVLFSSLNAEFGGRSFGAYSSANSFLNGFADHWAHERGRRVCCLSWSMWAGIGMNRGGSNDAAKVRGFRALSEEAGIEALGAGLATGRSNVIVGLDPDNAAVLRELVPEQLGAAEVVVGYTASREVDPSTLDHLAAGCPLPVRFLRVTELPANLDELLAAAAVPSRHYVEPITELESRLAAIWSDVLRRPRVGRDDSFFEIGGNSMRAVQLVSRISGALGVSVPVHYLYENPTVGALGDALTRDPTLTR